MKIRKKTLQCLFILLGVVIAVLWLLPVYILVISSIKEPASIFLFHLFPTAEEIRLQNFVDVFQKVKFLRYILNSFVIATTVTLVALLFHMMAGFAFSTLRFPLKKTIFTWMISTMMISFSVIMIPLFIIVKSLGLIDTLWAVILPMIPHAYGIFLYRQFFKGVPRDLYEAGIIDGASHFKILFRVYTPLSVPITLTMAVSFFLTNWNNYLWPMVVTQKQDLWVVQVAISSFKDAYSAQWNLILAASVIAAIPTIVLFVIFQRYFVEGIKLSGVKG